MGLTVMFCVGFANPNIQNIDGQPFISILIHSSRYVSNWLRKHYRRHIETDISQLERLFPHTIRAVTAEGFLFKLVGFIVAYNILLSF